MTNPHHPEPLSLIKKALWPPGQPLRPLDHWEGLAAVGDGQLIAEVATGKTLLDIARFELEAQAVLQATVAVISSRTDLAKALDKGPLAATTAA